MAEETLKPGHWVDNSPDVINTQKDIDEIADEIKRRKVKEKQPEKP